LSGLLGYDPNPLLLLGFAAVLTGGLAILVVARRPCTLTIARSTVPSRFLSVLVLSAVHSYLAMVPICGIAAYVLVLLLGNIGANDVGMFVVLFAIWFPLWLAPGVGALWASRRIRAGWKPKAAWAGGSVVGPGKGMGRRLTCGVSRG